MGAETVSLEATAPADAVALQAAAEAEAAIALEPSPSTLTITPEDQKHNPVTSRFVGTLATARAAGVM